MKQLIICLIIIVSSNFSYSQNYKTGDIAYGISIGANSIDYKSTMELVLRNKSILIRNKQAIKDASIYEITNTKYLEENTIRYDLTSKSGFVGYLLIDTNKRQMCLIEEGRNPTYITIIKTNKYE